MSQKWGQLQLNADPRHILVKVIEAKPKVARHIVTTTNSQTKIDPIYLRTATDPIHDKIETALPNFGFYYERVKNQYYEDETVQSRQIVTLPYLTRAIIATFMGDPGAARGGPDKFSQKHYGKMFSHSSKPEFFGNIAKTMRRVDEYLVSHVPLKNDRTNLAYYVAYDVVRSMIKREHLQRAMISQLKVEKLSDAALEASLKRADSIYRELISKGIEPDVVGKGRDFANRLRQELLEKYPAKLRAKRTSTLGDPPALPGRQ